MAEQKRSEFSVEHVLLSMSGACILRGRATEGVLEIPRKHINEFIKGVQSHVTFKIPDETLKITSDNPVISLIRESIGEQITIIVPSDTPTNSLDSPSNSSGQQVSRPVVVPSDNQISGTIIGVEEISEPVVDAVGTKNELYVWILTLEGDMTPIHITRSELPRLRFNSKIMQERLVSALERRRTIEGQTPSVPVILHDATTMMHFRTQIEERYAMPKMTCFLNMETKILDIFMTIYNSTPYNWGSNKKGIPVTIATNNSNSIRVPFYPSVFEETHLPRREFAAMRMAAPKHELEMEAASFRVAEDDDESSVVPDIVLGGVVLNQNQAVKHLLRSDKVFVKRGKLLTLQSCDQISHAIETVFISYEKKDANPMQIQGVVTILQENKESLVVDRAISKVEYTENADDFVFSEPVNSERFFELRKLPRVYGTLTEAKLAHPIEKISVSMKNFPTIAVTSTSKLVHIAKIANPGDLPLDVRVFYDGEIVEQSVTRKSSSGKDMNVISRSIDRKYVGFVLSENNKSAPKNSDFAVITINTSVQKTETFNLLQPIEIRLFGDLFLKTESMKQCSVLAEELHDEIENASRTHSSETGDDVKTFDDVGKALQALTSKLGVTPKNSKELAGILIDRIKKRE